MDASATHIPHPQPNYHSAAHTAPFITQSSRPDPNPNPSRTPLSDPTVRRPAVRQASDCYGEYSYFGAASVPKGGFPECFGLNENISDCSRSINSNSASRLSDYGCVLLDRMQPQPPYRPLCMQSCIPYDTSNAPVHVATGTTHNIFRSSVHKENSATPCHSFKASGHMNNGTTPSNISEPSHVEHSTLPNNISEASKQVPDSSLNADDFSREFCALLENNSSPHPGIRRLVCVKVGETPACRRAGRKGKVNSDGKGATYNDAQCSRMSQWLQAVSGKQLMSGDVNAVQQISPCHPRANWGGFPGHADEAIGSPPFIAKDAPLHVILESMQSLSDMLLSARFDDCELKDPDREVLQSVTDKLGAFIINNKKDFIDSKVNIITSEWEHVGQPEIKTSMRGGDEVIGQGLNVSAASTGGDLDSCTTSSDSGGGISSGWELVDEIQLL